MQCNVCKQIFSSLDSLRRHASRKHKINSQVLYDEYVIKNNIPKCKCGCNQIPAFISFEKGYHQWIRGHISKVKNNWGHNKKAIDNSAQTRREQYENGERKVWNAGLTKESDERVKKYGENIRLSFDVYRKNTYSQFMRKARLSGIIPTRFGKNSANWKGGTSSINNLVRANKRLYDEWIYPILVRDGFKCVECSNNKTLEVHHSKETMAEILSKYVGKESEYDFNEKRDIMNKVIDYHISNEVEGKTLCKECHKKIHPSYNV